MALPEVWGPEVCHCLCFVILLKIWSGEKVFESSLRQQEMVGPVLPWGPQGRNVEMAEWPNQEHMPWPWRLEALGPGQVPLSPWGCIGQLQRS